MSDSCVLSGSVKNAAEGREIDILVAIGVEWRRGLCDHIHCPYPDHADNDPSWRWDERKRKAFCTCGDKADSIFDVVSKVEGVDFERAKLRVAEILGRSDLIRVRSDGGDNGAPRQAVDAASLLAPPASNRDDELVRRYLGARLGIDLDEVPRPATPIVGIKQLGYYDPAPKGGKRKLVGTWPCAVFGTVDCDGRHHAHRIYLAPDATGKANLGETADGKPRNPKKSARALEGDKSTAGRSVVWGDSTRAVHEIVVEGIETAAAIALAFRDEVDAGEILVASAITAGGVEAFRPWPATRLLTIAADRDEAENGTGFRRGERAARKLVLSGGKHLETRIALPGNAGESVDWLDILTEYGAEKVRAGILAASGFAPTEDEIVEQQAATDRDAEVEKIARAYPIPEFEEFALQYRHNRNGKVRLHRMVRVDKDATGETTERWVPISSPISIPAWLCYADRGGATGLRVIVQGLNGAPHYVDFERAAIPRLRASEIRSALFEAGLVTYGGGEAAIVAMLRGVEPPRRITVVSRAGWHRLPEQRDPIFVCPSGAVIGAPEHLPLELAVGARLRESAPAGTLKDWRRAVTAAVDAENCPHWILGAAAGFAGVLSSLVDLGTTGISLTGYTTTGKTTAQRIAVSAWSSPEIGRGLLESMKATENAVEALAQRSDGTILCLDELGISNGQVLGRLIYAMSSGIGKARMNAHAVLRERYSWSTFVVFSGEMSLEERVKSDGGTWMAGMALRIPDIDVAGVNRAVRGAIIERIDGLADNYGHAGPWFVSELIRRGLHRHQQALRDRIFEHARLIAGASAPGTTVRAALPFALLFVAGELAMQFEILPGDMRLHDAVIWAWRGFAGGAPSVDEQAINALRVWIAERWDVRIHEIAGSPVPLREAVAWYDQNAVYIPSKRIIEACGGSLSKKHIGQMLRQHKLLYVQGGDTVIVRNIPGVAKIDAYALSRTAVGRGAMASYQAGSFSSPDGAGQEHHGHH